MIITSDFNAPGQAATLTQIEERDGVKYRVYLKRDSYDFQSYGHVEVWSPTDLRWNRVHTLEGGDPLVCGLPDAYTYRAAVNGTGTGEFPPGAIRHHYEVVADDLIDLAQRVVT